MFLCLFVSLLVCLFACSLFLFEALRCLLCVCFFASLFLAFFVSLFVSLFVCLFVCLRPWHLANCRATVSERHAGSAICCYVCLFVSFFVSLFLCLFVMFSCFCAYCVLSSFLLWMRKGVVGCQTKRTNKTNKLPNNKQP